MNTEQILQFIDAVSNSSLSEFKYEGDGVKFSLKKSAKGKSGNGINAFSGENDDFQTNNTFDSNPIIKNEMEEEAVKEQEKHPAGEGNVIKSPLVGTFYAAPSEDLEPFVKPGDHVEKGQVLAIVEAMKLMNEIESDFAGTVTEILVVNGQAVEYGQPLFVIR